MDGEVLIVDEHTGRMLAGRRYNDGLHQAIEAKEGVTVREEYQTLATVTLQNYFRLYEKLSGMTGTAMTEASEFDKIYKLGVVPIPTNKPMPRIDQADLVYRTEEAKYDAVVEDIAERHAKGQPILVGTVSVEKSEHLSEKLRAARHPAHRAERQGARRRGEDRRDGRPQGCGHGRHQHGRSRHRHHARRLGRLPRRRGAAQAGPRPGRDTPRSTKPPGPRMVEQIKAQVAAEHDEVKELGGLYVVGTERHESRRIDNQLRGRSGRQGDPGESRFYLSLAGRADAAVQVRLGRPGAPGPQDPRRRPDREQAGHRRDRQRPGPGRVAELRVPQERPQVRRRDGPPAQGDLRRAPPGARGRRPRGADPHLHRRRRHRLRHRRHPGASPRSGTSRRCGPRCARSTRCRWTSSVLEKRGRRPRQPRPRRADRGAQGGRPRGLRPPRGGGRRGGHARARAARRALGARPQVARAPLRDGLPARGHLPARLLPARPARRVPARGLRHVRRDDGRHQGGVGRLPVQPRGPGRGGRGGRVEEAEEVEVVEPMRRARCPTPTPRREAAADPGQGPRPPAAARSSCPTPPRPRPARPRSTRPRPATPTTRTPGSAATPSAPAARARSTSSATAPRAARPG